MKTSFIKVIAGTLLLGTATLAAAQTPSRAQAFASQFAQMQSLSGNTASTYAYKTPPALHAQADDPASKPSFGENFATLQAESSNSSEFEAAPTLTARAADPIGHASFSETYDRMQAASSNSGEFKELADGGETAYAKADSATDTGKPTIGQRIARLMHRAAPDPVRSVE